MKAIQTEMYVCEVCNKPYLKFSDATKCEKSCKKALRDLENYQKLKKEADDIRLTSTSLSEVIKRTAKFMKKQYGVDIVFDSYPDKISMQYISHDAPIGVKTIWDSRNSGGLPTEYLAFKGRWTGNITKDKKAVSFSDYIGTFKRDHLINFLHSGSGSSGSKFSVDGCIFLQDFPLIEQQYNEYIALKEKETANKELRRLKTAIFNKELAEAVNNDPEVSELMKVHIELNSKLDSLRAYMSEVIDEKRKLYEKDFIHILEIEKDYDEDRFKELQKSFK